MAQNESAESPRTVLVTGGAYGIGRAIVRRFAQHGSRVLIADRDKQHGQELASELSGRAEFFEADLRDPNCIELLLTHAHDRWEGLDVLCNNAGIEINRRSEEFTMEEWNAMYDVNLRAAFLCSKLAFPLLAARHGCIINIASVQGIACEANTSVYASTKGGLLALTRGMAIDFASSGVRVNAICPGAIQTGMMEKYLASAPDAADMLDALAARIPMRRIGRPEEIAGVAYFLASQDASYITGSALVADGGLLAKLGT